MARRRAAAVRGRSWRAYHAVAGRAAVLPAPGVVVSVCSRRGDPAAPEAPPPRRSLRRQSSPPPPVVRRR